jgi:hypothetical protein
VAARREERGLMDRLTLDFEKNIEEEMGGIFDRETSG